jgi:hypothetical protein
VSCEFLLLLLVSLLNVVGFSTFYFGGPTFINDDAVVPAAAVISGFNSIPAFYVINTMMAVLLSLSFLLLLAFLLSSNTLCVTVSCLTELIRAYNFSKENIVLILENT